MSLNREIPMVKSRFIRVLESDAGIVIWHSLFGNPKIISTETLDFLSGFNVPKNLNTVLNNVEDKGTVRAVQDLVDAYYLVPFGFDERAFLNVKMGEREEKITSGAMIDYLSLIVSEMCNFRCVYCIHFNNLETSSRLASFQKTMTFAVAKRAVDAYLSIIRQHGKKTAEINFGGGEPLLAWSTLERIFEYCIRSYGREFTFKFSVNTNASLITPTIARKFKQYGVEVASSLDGLKEANNRVRLNRNGKGTFEKIVAGFKNLEAAGYPLDGFSVTVNEQNFSLIDEGIVDWAVKQGMSEVRIDIDVIGMVAVPVTDIVEKIELIRRYAAKKQVDIPGFWARPAENMNESTLETQIAFCGAARGNSICVDPRGNVYGCGYSSRKLGQINHMEKLFMCGGKYHRFVRSRLTGAMKMCRGCIIEGQCGGGCVITHEFARTHQTLKIGRMCEFYRLMTQKLLLEQLSGTR